MAFGLFLCAVSFNMTNRTLVNQTMWHNLYPYRHHVFLLRRILTQFVQSWIKNNYADQRSPEWLTKNRKYCVLRLCNTVHVNVVYICSVLLFYLCSLWPAHEWSTWLYFRWALHSAVKLFWEVSEPPKNPNYTCQLVLKHLISLWKKSIKSIHFIHLRENI